MLLPDFLHYSNSRLVCRVNVKWLGPKQCLLGCPAHTVLRINSPLSLFLALFLFFLLVCVCQLYILSFSCPAFNSVFLVDPPVCQNWSLLIEICFHVYNDNRSAMSPCDVSCAKDIFLHAFSFQTCLLVLQPHLETLLISACSVFITSPDLWRVRMWRRQREREQKRQTAHPRRGRVTLQSLKTNPKAGWETTTQREAEREKEEEEAVSSSVLFI